MNNEEFSRLVRFILKRREDCKDISRSELMYIGDPFSSQEKVLRTLKITENFDVTWQEWESAWIESDRLMEHIVALEKKADYLTVSDPTIRTVIDPHRRTDYWNQYRERLESTLSLDSALLVHASCKNILSRLDGKPSNGIRGLVHGSVQSGKTANMEGLIALASDYDFNVFIVLTGTIISLNEQTESRFMRDLYGRFSHTILSPANLSKSKIISPQAKTVCVSMKTTAKLKKIANWLNNAPNRDKLKVLIIDDEADYASIDSSSDSVNRTRTNKLLLNLVNQKTVKGEPLPTKYGAMNYIAYTATPYANLLNESGPESLYPRDFIMSLDHSNIYFGPQQIFGVNYGDYDYPGLPIVNVSHDLDSNCRRLEKGITTDLPEELKEALSWFICSVAALRFRGYKSPLSMMINTTHNVDPHLTIGKAVKDYLDSKENYDTILKYCRIVYERETRRFTKGELKLRYPNFPIHVLDEIQDYPSFIQILPNIEELLSDVCHHIHGDDDCPQYFKTIHICIENGTKQNVEDDPEATVIPRIRYPREGESYPDAPAFIIIGGNVLSRGLTLKGLVTSFFVRPVTTADTLMQMGRWFGYRTGYELYPRIWMSSKSFLDFQYLAELDESLRQEIMLCNQNHSSPHDTAIRLLAIPKLHDRGFIKGLSARNKTKAMIPSNISYIGKYEEFARFRRDYDMFQRNINLTREFLSGLSEYGPDIPAEKDWNVIRWKNVPSTILMDGFVSKFENRIDDNCPQGGSLCTFTKWLQEMIDKDILDTWTILLAGKNESDIEKRFVISDNVSIGKIERSRENTSDDFIHIKTLRNKTDLFKDVFPSEFKDRNMLGSIRRGSLSTSLRIFERKSEWINEHPLLIIYCIDGKSEPKKKCAGNAATDKKSSDKVALDSEVDIVSFLVEVPNIDTRDADMVQIELDVDHLDLEDDL